MAKTRMTEVEISESPAARDARMHAPDAKAIAPSDSNTRYFNEQMTGALKTSGNGAGGSRKSASKKKRRKPCPFEGCDLDAASCGHNRTCRRRDCGKAVGECGHEQRGRTSLGKTTRLKVYLSSWARSFLRSSRLTLSDVFDVVLESPAMKCWKSHSRNGYAVASLSELAFRQKLCTCVRCVCGTTEIHKPCECWRCELDGGGDIWACDCWRCVADDDVCECWRCDGEPPESAGRKLLSTRHSSRSVTGQEWLFNVAPPSGTETTVRVTPDQSTRFVAIGKGAPSSWRGARYSNTKFAEYCIEYFADLVAVSRNAPISSRYSLDATSADEIQRLKALATRCYRCAEVDASSPTR